MTTILITCNTSYEAYLIIGIFEINENQYFLAKVNLTNLMPNYCGIMEAGD
ncbi:MAG: hypothetical protein LT105_03820 [Lentimicrobium sp.]|nr:hypothetical protein [Lentimicrobium sp.]